MTKQEQLEIINKYNPMLDDYHVGIREISDIKTFKEAVDEAMNDYKEYGSYSSYPDITNKIIEDSLSTGKIKIYSSYPIIPGVFVTPSKMQANEYAGGEKIYSKLSDIDDIAWINVDEGMYTKI